MKLHFALLAFFLAPVFIKAQPSYRDNLKQGLMAAKEDTNKVNIYAELTLSYMWQYPDSAIKYGTPGLDLASELNFHGKDAFIFFALSEAFSKKGNFPKALQVALKSLSQATKSGEFGEISLANLTVGNVYYYSGEYQKALEYFRRIWQIRSSISPEDTYRGTASLGATFFHLNQVDSALYYLEMAYSYGEKKKSGRWLIPYFYLGKTYLSRQQYDTALHFYREGIAVTTQKLGFVDGYIGIANVFKEVNIDSAIHYAKLAVMLSQETGSVTNLSLASETLANLFISVNRPDSAFKYFKLGIAARDSLYSIAGQNLSFNEQLNQQELANEQQKAKSRIRMNYLFGALAIFLLILFFLWRNNTQKQKAKIKIEEAYNQLKKTQQQLIQQEKMASLGELTAGIAHEIQNPLNFVNNFSDVNKELLEELKAEANKGNIDEVKAIANDVITNEEKINHHGKRADAIVKGMLQHSRASSGQKEFADINALAAEYLTLAYHGLRAKDKTFNVTTKTEFDNSLGKIGIVPQEIGRALLNLINNAFYAVSEKQKQNLNGYEPVVTISTAKQNGKVEIKVIDNGNGIPKEIFDKVFQPFFTTKPTGQGTGLGLSLAYDIITKGHGGELKVETVEGSGSEFVISLPI